MSKPRVDDEAPDAEVFAAVQAALERKPDVAMPAYFARRVATRVGAFPPSRRSRAIPYARLTAMIVCLVVAISLFALAPSTAADFRDRRFDLELLVLLQLGVLAWWLGRQPSQSR